MKSLILKILGIFGTIFAIFQLGKRSGKAALKNEINKQTLEDVKKATKNNKINSNLTRNELINKLSTKD